MFSKGNKKNGQLHNSEGEYLKEPIYHKEVGLEVLR